MAFDDHTNFAYSTLTNAPGTAGTTFSVQAGDGAKFPIPPFNATVWPAGVQPTGAASGNAEIIRVTGIATDDLTATRTQEGSTNRNITPAGYQIAATITDKTITDIEASAAPTISYYRNLVPQNSVAPYATLGIPFDTLVIQPLSPVEELGFPGNMTISTWLMHMSGSATATSLSSSYSSTVLIGLYSFVNSTQISMVNSVSTTWARAAATGNTTNWLGPRFLTIHSSQWSSQPVLSYRTKYWWGVIHRSNNFSAMGALWLGQYIGASTTHSGTVGVSQATNVSRGPVPFLGVISSQTSLPATIGNSQVTKANATAGFNPGIVLENLFSVF